MKQEFADDIINYEFKNNIICTECNRVLTIKDSTFKDYFHSIEISCPSCRKKLDLWNCLKSQIETSYVNFGWHFGLLGCIGKVINIFLTPKKNYKLDLSKEIENGELLYIVYTPDLNGLFPIQMNSNTPISHRMDKIINLLPYATKENASKTKVQVFVWIAPKEMKEDLSTMLQLDAFRKFYEENHRHMLVSAQTSIEILQYKFLDLLLKSNEIGKKRRESFLQDKATFSVQCFTLMPLLSKILNFPLPEKRIIDGFKWLVEDRNDVVHRGIPKKSWEKNRLQNELLSAFMLFKYFRIIHKVN